MGLCDEIRADILRDVQSAMTDVNEKTREAMDEELISFYDRGNPVLYQRTGGLIQASNVTPVSSVGNSFTFTAEYDAGRMSHDTGHFTEEEILEASETGTHGVLGNSGFWERTSSRIPEILESVLSKKFG